VTLRQKIQQEIHDRGPIPFSRYMEMCLYDPEFGYYSHAQEKFGKGGDFYTSSDVHAVFGRLLARQFEEMWRALDSPEQIEVLELGPGRGLFAQDVLDWSEKTFPDFYRAVHYTLAESSPSLAERLASQFRKRIEAGKVTVLAGLSDVGPSSGAVAQTPTGEAAHRSAPLTLRPTRENHEPEGFAFSRAEKPPKLQRTLSPEVPLIVFANEFFDALPVEILSAKGSLRVAARDGRFLDEWAASTKDELDFLDHYGVHPDTNGRTEVALRSQSLMTRVAAGIERGFLIAIDYGYTREQQLAGRYLDTLMTYRRHTTSPDPYQAPGAQDITAHVNFTALSGAAEQGGLQVKKLRTQSQFLLGIGEATQFADAFEECRLPQERAKVAMQLKHLITPEGMGDTFQVLVASKGVDASAVETLSGLSFSM